ncbi:hypothetical protein EVAR_37174_1 [Eumeta japonica]|uniref:Uncharacterized protein n=1 Tax=Eumeta variegata TaxID=151549 RepID=A0A4C1WHU8_EUMVA|nr:hypothetical protein EVAR_37174_1 [Eumeta japonica]
MGVFVTCLGASSTFLTLTLLGYPKESIRSKISPAAGACPAEIGPGPQNTGHMCGRRAARAAARRPPPGRAPRRKGPDP